MCHFLATSSFESDFNVQNLIGAVAFTTFDYIFRGQNPDILIEIQLDVQICRVHQEKVARSEWLLHEL